MSPLHIQCSNTFCTGRAEKLGALCPACQKQADEQAAKYEANKWRGSGWSRHDEREQLQGKVKPK